MNGSEYNVLSSILSKVQLRDNNNTWGNNGYCSLSIQSIANTWGISRAIVQRSINTLELAGIISVQRCYGSTHTITLTPHTEWVEVNFRELRSPSKKQRVSPATATPSLWVEDTNTTPNTPDTDTPATPSADIVTPSLWVEGTRYPYRVLTNTPATPSADTDTTPAAVVVNTTDTLCTNVADTPYTPSADTPPAAVTGGNGKKQLPILKQRVSPTPATPSPYTTPTEAESLRFNNNKNGKKQRVSPTPTPATPSAEDTPVTDTPPDTDI